MDFAFNTAQTELFDRARTFARDRLNVGLAERIREGRFPRPEWRLCGEFGLLGLSVPERYGGMGLDALTTAGLIEAFGAGCEDGGLMFSASAHLFACVMPVLLHGSEALRARVLPLLASGAWIGANAITEAEAGSDAFTVKSTATRVGSDYVLHGTKTFVTNGPVADAFVVYASTEPTHGYLGLSAFLVERGTPGLVVGAPFEKIGLATSPMSAIYLEECRVSEEQLLGREGDGARAFGDSMRWERACLFAAYLGAMDRQLDQVVTFARERRQFKKPIGKYQAISHRIADMKLRLESARLLLYRACWLIDRGEEPVLEVALGKLAVSEAAIRSGLDAIQIHGGSGIISETGVSRALMDALPSAIFSGTSEIQRDLIARGLGL